MIKEFLGGECQFTLESNVIMRTLSLCLNASVWYSDPSLNSWVTMANCLTTIVFTILKLCLNGNHGLTDATYVRYLEHDIVKNLDMKPPV